MSTYRIQFHRQYSISAAAEIVPYLAELGIGDCYASPLFQAGPESTHGYDICCFGNLNPGIGTEEEFRKLCGALRERGMGVLLDMVPNHMGNDLTNHWWVDVLEKGPHSRYATYFDINWQPLKSDLYNKVLLPTLGDHYGKVLLKGEMRLGFEAGRFFIAYYDKKFPIALHSYPPLLRKALEHEPSLKQERVEQARSFDKLMETPGQWQLGSDESYAKIAEFQAELGRWEKSSPGFRRGLGQVLQQFRGQSDNPGSFDALDALIQQQFYRLAYWRVGPEEINYRRFFDVTSLVSLKMEREEVFEASHRYLYELLGQELVTGLRIDHPDGLWDPKQYFERLQDRYRKLKGVAQARNAGSGKEQALYVVAEKILTGDETLPADWPVAGTTGYDFLNYLNGIFVHQANEGAFDALYREFTGIDERFEDLVYRSKKWILTHSLYSEWVGLTHRLKRIALACRVSQDFTFRQLQKAIGEVAATFPVYRTYAREEISELPSHEQEYVREAVRLARERDPSVDEELWTFFQDLLLLRPPPGFEPGGCIECREFVMKFQQLSGPLMAKGLEDTAFYNYNRLVSLNEVGGSPEHFGVSPGQFHAYNRMRAEQWPHSLSATATHDTKRGEDLRARINVLSEAVSEWREKVLQWRDLNRDKKVEARGRPAPHPNDEYLFYQTLVGAWDPGEDMGKFRERVFAYMEKAMKEAKARTTWTEPDAEYEEAVKEFIGRVLEQSVNQAFWDSFRPFQAEVAYWGRFQSLAQTLLKVTAPGVPDFYQGTELWDLSLVDPDNRRPVDYKKRQELLQDLKSRLEKQSPEQVASELLAHPESGQAKMFVILMGLQARRRLRPCFENGSYEALGATGAGGEHIIAFKRSHGDQEVIVIAPRLLRTLSQGAKSLPHAQTLWKDTVLEVREGGAGTTFRNLITGETVNLRARQGRGEVRLAEVLKTFPVALLEREERAG